MKKVSLLFCLSIMLLFGFRSYATVGITISVDTSGPICGGTSYTFSASPGTGAYGYIWNINGSYVGSSSPTLTTTLVSGTDMIYCVLTNAAGDTIDAISDTMTLTVDTIPTASPISGPVPTSVCVGDSINLTDASAGGMWVSGNTANATVSNTGGVTGISVPAGGGFGGGAPSVRIYYILTNACGSDSVRIRVSVATPPSQIMLANTTVCIDSSVSISDSAAGGSWSVSNAAVGSVGFLIGGGFPPTFGEGFTGTEAGTTTIYFNDTNACGIFSESATVTVIDCSSTAVPVVSSVTNSCNIYPNPSTGTFNIIANSSKYNQAHCTVANLIGEQIKDFTINTNQETSVDLGMPTGVYFITVSAGDEKYSKKVVIME